MFETANCPAHLTEIGCSVKTLPW